MDILSKTKAKEFKALSQKKTRDEQGLFLAEGDKCVLDTIESFTLEYLIATEAWMISHPEIIISHKDKVLQSDKRGIEIISSLKSLPDVIAVFQKLPHPAGIPKLNPKQLYLLLDEIQDPGNLGTIVRTCDWFGVYEIFASIKTVDVYGPKVVQATVGSLSRVHVHYLDLEALIENNRNLPVIGTLLNGKSLNEFTSGTSGLLLMGNEGKGISSGLKKMIDRPLTIPPVNKASHPDSLNVAVATAIILSHLK